MARGRARRQLYYGRRGTRRVSRRKWQARARRHVGLPKNYSTSKTTETILPGVASTRNRHVILPRALITVGIGTGINQRLRDTIFVGGIRIDGSIECTNDKDTWYNWAVVNNKAGAGGNDIVQTQADFFRDYTDERAWDANAVNKTGISWANAAINTDRYNVLKRGKFKLAGLTGGTDVNNVNNSVKSFKIWVKIGRTFTFDDAIGGCEDQVFFVSWLADTTNGAFYNQNAGGTERIRAILYYRDPKTA